MRIKAFAKALIGTEKVVIEAVNYEPIENKIVLSVRPPKRELCRCGLCHKKAKHYDAGRGRRRWRSVDIGSTEVFVEADAPRVKCKKHGVVSASVPWARHHTNFTKIFEETAAWLAAHTSKTVVSEYMRVHWRTVGEICNRVYEDLKNEAPSLYDGLVNIGIDETSYKKGHKYMTVVLNHDTNSVVWCSVGHGKEVLSRFFEQLTPEQRASIRCVSADGAKWIASCIEEYCPNAERCIDPFHVVSWATEILDTERRKAWASARKAIAESAKSKTIPKEKGNTSNAEKKEAT